MKFDMAGGAAVIETVAALAELEAPVRVLAVVGATENMTGGAAMRPGDILTALDGTTIEMNNSDAEGRLVLADCITWAKREGVDAIVDIATLTGAAEVALGHVYAALLSNDDELAALALASGERTGERLWRLPLDPAYAELIKGRYAQLVNRSERRVAGAITAAELLHHFAGTTPWAHLDIAGVGDDGTVAVPRQGRDRLRRAAADRARAQFLTRASRALEDRLRGAGRIELARDDPVEQLAHLVVAGDRLLQLAAQPVGRDREHLVHQVAPAALGQRPLRLDVGAVLGERVGQLLDPVVADRLGADDRHLPARAWPPSASTPLISRTIVSVSGWSALLTTITSGISITPALSAWIESPEPGISTSTTVSAWSMMSTSAWPTPTVSSSTMSRPDASISSAACSAASLTARRARRGWPSSG